MANSFDYPTAIKLRDAARQPDVILCYWQLENSEILINIVIPCVEALPISGIPYAFPLSSLQYWMSGQLSAQA